MADSMEVDYLDAPGTRPLGTLEVEFHDALGTFEEKHRALSRSAGDTAKELETNLLHGLEDICTSWSREFRASATDKEAILNAEAVTWKVSDGGAEVATSCYDRG